MCLPSASPMKLKKMGIWNKTLSSSIAQLVQWEARRLAAGFNSQQMEEIFLYSTVSRQPLGSTQPPIHCVLQAISLGVKRPECEADHLPPSSAKAKNGGAIPTFPIRLQNVMLN
jgi:hypothetical protein